jgi:hypothetical protein
MTNQDHDDMHLHDVKELLTTLSPFEMLTAMIAGRSALQVLQELATRGITPENVDQLQFEVQNGLTMIETIARSQSVRMPDLDGLKIRAGGRRMH